MAQEQAQLLSLPQLLLLHARTRPHHPAFISPQRTATYAALATSTRRIAGHIASHVSRGDRIALVLPRCIEFVESVLAVTRAAAVGVPLDPRSSVAELRWALRDCGARVVVTDARRLGSVRDAVEGAEQETLIVVSGASQDASLVGAGQGAATVVRYEDWMVQAPNSVVDDACELDTLGLDEAAWLHYTSGTTGTPKGVLSSQAAWLISATNYAGAVGITAVDKLFWPLPLYHALGHSLCIVGALTAGLSVYLTGLGEGVLSSVLHCEGLTIMAGVPSTYHDLANDLAQSTRVGLTSRLPRPRVCICAGGTATSELRRNVKDMVGVTLLNSYASTDASGAMTRPKPTGASAFLEKMLGVPLLNRYGCTESCGAIAAVTPGDIYGGSPCGKPLFHMQVQVMSTNTEVPEAVEHGEEGEIWIRGPSMMLRYWDQQPHQQNPFANEGWYRTGDLGRLLGPHGDLSVTGRLSELIRRGSETIHPVEVEQIIRSCPGVDDVVVTGVPHNMLGETPAAFIVRAGEDVIINVLSLLTACRAALPEYKVPVAFFEIDALPRTKAGKLRRRAAVNCQQRKLSARHSIMHDMVLNVVLSEVRSVCGLGAEEHLDSALPFAELGMNSLASVVLRDRLVSLTGLDSLPMTLVFEHPTPAALSEHLRGRLFDITPMTDQATSTQASHTSSTPGAQNSSDPIAIVSMACSFPGSISSSADLWDVVASGVDVTASFPNDRGWDLDALSTSTVSNPKPGTSSTNRGGFLSNMAHFDPAPFKISPREALATDPQQRLLLETTWHLAERAHIAPCALRGTSTGVFVGVMYSDYAGRFLHSEPHELDSHLGLGSAASVAAGRISYTFDLQGPSMAIDTACSSSLVAMHLAANSLRARECSLAIAGGVTVMATPRPFVMFSRQGALAPDGRCKSYSASADGTAWSEGVGLLMLERLSDAKRNGHQILGLVRGSAVNSDGASNGLTAPSGPAQEQVTKQALANAGLVYDDVDVLEGHGTATPLGDAIEAQAVVATYGSSDREYPLLLGSVKSNIGHSQAAAGVAGVIKMVEAMRHGKVPRSLHVDKPSSFLASTKGVKLATEAQPWPHRARGGPRRAAVSSFGIGGTNSVVILEEYSEDVEKGARPLHPAPSNATRLHYPWLLSGADEASVRAQAGALLAHEACQEQEDGADIAYSLATTRSALSHRAVVFRPGGDKRDRASSLTILASIQNHTDVIEVTSGAAPRLAVFFSGQGSLKKHSIGDIKHLCAHFPVFDAAFRAVCSELNPRLAHPLSELIRGGDEDLFQRTDISQATIFAFEVAMLRLLEAFGVHPDVLVGHSVGEIAAAHVAGNLSLAGAAALVAIRGRLMASLPGGQGQMASIAASEDDVAKELTELAETCVIAAVNGPEAVVISGSTAGVNAVVSVFANRQHKVTLLTEVDHAFHSPLMDPILEELSHRLHNEPEFGSCPGHTSKPLLVSSVTGELAQASQFVSPEFWAHQMRSPVRFADAVDTVANMGATIFLEVGPSAPLSLHLSEAIATQGSPCTLLEALGRLWVRGVKIDWHAVFDGSGARLIDLPVYQFQRRRYWLDPPSRAKRAQDATRARYSGMEESHPILTNAVPVLGTPGSVVYHGALVLDKLPWLVDHIVGGQKILPATMFVELALHAGRECMKSAVILEEIAIMTPLVFVAPNSVMIQVVLGEAQESGGKGAGATRSVEIHSRPAQSPLTQGWTRHVTGTLKLPSSPSTPGAHVPMGAWQAIDVNIPRAYEALADAGFSYGPAFHCVRGVWRSQDGMFLQAKLQLPVHASVPKLSPSFHIHPALLDAALHVGMLIKATEKPTQGLGLHLPFLLRGVQTFGHIFGDEPVFVRIPIRKLPGEDRSHSLTLVDLEGNMVAVVAEVVTRPWSPAPRGTDLFKLTWSPLDATAIENRTPPISSQIARDQVVHIRSSGVQHGRASLSSTVHRESVLVLTTIQGWAMDEAFASGGRLVIVTENASTSDTDLVAAAVWGLVRSAQAEFGRDRLVLIDLDGTIESVTAIPEALASRHGLLAIRGGQMIIPSLERVQIRPPLNKAIEPLASLDTSGVVLITGGTGAIGALVARHIARRYNAKTLLLLSRSGPSAPGATTLHADLSSTGATVRISACDVADRAQISAILTSSHPPVTAIIHTAGVLDDGVLSAQTAHRIAAVLRPKVDAAWLLHKLSGPATQLFLFSSASGMLGNRGQAGYAAGNCFLDGLARYRRARGLHALSLAWGPWKNEAGMAGGVKHGGVLGAMTDEQGLGAFDMALRMSGEEAVLVPLFMRGGPVESLPVLGGNPTLSLNKSRGDRNAQTPSWREPLNSTRTREDRIVILLDLVRAEVAKALGYQAGDTLPDRPFSDLGMDSFSAIQLRNSLSVLSGLKGLPATLVFDTNTFAALVEDLLARMENLTGQKDVESTIVGGPFGATTSVADERNSRITRQSEQASPIHAPRQEHRLPGLASLCHGMSQAGHHTAATHMLAAASLVLPRFTTFSPQPNMPSPRRLATGPPAGLALIVIPDFANMATGDKGRYTALAAALGNDHDMYELQHPTTSVPDSLDALAEMHARTIQDVFASKAIILLGYSAGGCVAHAVAQTLSRTRAGCGDRLVGLVLIDTYAVSETHNPEWLMALALPTAAMQTQNGSEGEGDVEARLAVMGAYLRIVSGWYASPLPRRVGTLFVRAAEPIPGADEGWCPAEWLLADTTVGISAHHLTILDDWHARAVADVIRKWVQENIIGMNR